MAEAKRRPRRLAALLLRAESLVVLATVVAAALRFSRLGAIPPGLNQDEAVNGYDAYSLLLTGRDHLGHAFPIAGLESLGDWASPLLTFLTVPAVGLFGLEIETIRGVSAAVGALAVPAAYWLTIELFSVRLVGVVAAWVIALSPWHVHLSRWAIPPTLVPTILTCTLLALVWSVQRRSSRGIVVTAILAGLTIASYPTMKLYVPLLGLAAVAVYWRELLRIKREALAYAALAVLLIAGPILYLSTRDPGGRASTKSRSLNRLVSRSMPRSWRSSISPTSPRSTSSSRGTATRCTSPAATVPRWRRSPPPCCSGWWGFATACCDGGSRTGNSSPGSGRNRPHWSSWPWCSRRCRGA